MWLTSKRPAKVRTAWCSSIMPEYWTGISQPPKSTILAPRPRWTEFSGVVRSEGAVGMKIQANSTEKGVSTNGGRGPGTNGRVVGLGSPGKLGAAAAGGVVWGL